MPKPPTSAAWWRSAVIYQVYIRSFADGSGDGIGDLAGLRARLPHLADLGVDALWLNPWYPSPMADGGYDVADYRDIDPMFGTLADAQAMIDEAHDLGLRVLIDIVPNHSSSQHPWFQEALAAEPSSPARERYHFRPGLGEAGERPPNDWKSAFGGSAWTRTVGPDGAPADWYLHLFAPEQPDLNWENPEIRAEFESILRFWFDRGVDGIRIDVAHALIKAPGLPDVGPLPEDELAGFLDHPAWDRDGVHEIFRGWRAVADSYDPPRAFVAEAWTGDPARLARYVRPDELHTAFNFDYLMSPWRAPNLRRSIDTSLSALGEVGAPATWVLSNHDVARHVSRYARHQPDRPVRALAELRGEDDFDLALGTRRARAALLLTLALPGGAYVYQGEELGLWEVEDLPEELLQDPTWERSERTDRGRDGCRVPIPWSDGHPPFGYSPPSAEKEPWLPQPEAWSSLTVQAQTGDPASMLELYRSALHRRRQEEALGDGGITWVSQPEDEVLSFTRGSGFGCVVNFAQEPAVLPEGSRVVLASGPLDDEGRLPADTAVWLAV